MITANDAEEELQEFLRQHSIMKNGKRYCWNQRNFDNLEDLRKVIAIKVKHERKRAHKKASPDAEPIRSLAEMNCIADMRSSKELEARMKASQIRIVVPNSGARGISVLFGLIGLVTIFFVPPVGLIMLMTSGLASYFKTKKVDGVEGECPSCKRTIQTACSESLLCPACGSKIAYGHGMFVPRY